MFVTERFAQAALQLRSAPLPNTVVHHAKRAVIDWHAALYPGMQTSAVRHLLQAVSDEIDHGAARLADGRKAPARIAALVNGAAAHAAELDDSFRDAMYHPGAATIAAAMAAGQAQGVDGMQFLRAVITGYEVSTRIGVVMGRAHYKFWHNTGTVGTFGAAAAAAEILRLDASAFAHALATAGTFAAGLQQAFRTDSMSKPLHPGRAAEGGLLAAQYAAAGASSSLDILEGDAGFGQALGDGPDWSSATQGFGSDFHVTRLTFKNHVGCGHAFPAIDGALALQRQHGVRVEDIQAVEVGTYAPALEIACHARPETANEARFSIPYMVATALVHGSVRMSAFEPMRLRDQNTQALLERITTHLDADIDALFPAQRAARVRIRLRDGRSVEHFQANRKGDPEEPLDDADLENKLLEFATPVIGAAPARQLLQDLWHLDARADVRLGPSLPAASASA